MEKHVVEHYPVENLPPELREGLEAGSRVKVTVEVEAKPGAREPRPLSQLMGSAKGLFASPEEVDDFIRQLRDEWD